MFENPSRSKQARNFTTNSQKILDLKSSSEQIFSENWRSTYWGCYQIRSLIKSFKTYRLNRCLSFANYFWGLSYFYLDRVQLECKANQDREKIKGSILYNKLFQSDLISRNVSFQSSFLSSLVWIIRHQSRNQNISLPLSHSVSLQWPA